MKRTLFLFGLAVALVLSASVAAPPAHPQSSDHPQPKFQLYGPAADAVDPENPSNEVVQFDTTSGAPVLMFRKLNVRVRELDNQLEFKYYMLNRNCGAGSPRIDLGLDTNNDGRPDAFLEGHVQPDFLCAQNKWVFQDLTDDLARWGSRGNLPGGPGPGYVPWSVIETAFGDVPVLYGMLVEDSQAFKPDNKGIAYYDLVTIGDRTYTDHSDSARCDPSQGCSPQ